MASPRFDELDRKISETLWKLGVPTMRIGLGIVFVWFGALKVVGSSPAAELVTKTVYWFDPAWFVPFLGWWEVAIGVCLAVPALTRVGIALLAFQMPGTFLPLVLLPQVCFQDSVFQLTLEGQYIVKNLVIIGSALVLGGLVRRNDDR
ncbi:MAG: hypothetical protein KatS3mg015_0583 [Fimbriimonadales bacterium]|nr:MAG: hypothetical protein KatS3mg015_0583 [Fimbriimonadales bacterium]